MTVAPIAPTPFNVEQRLSMLIHAFSKTGKSTLTGTAPQPVLVLDAEGSWRFIPVRKVYWDPVQSAPPVYDGTWDACIVTVREWRTIELVYQWMLQPGMPFVSAVLDSITEIQRRCRANMKGEEAMKIQDWGILLAVMDKTIRGFRDLTLIPTSNVRCVVFVAETRQSNDGRWVPYMQGQISTSLPYWVDICGYLYADNEIDANGQPTEEVRRLFIGKHPSYESGERVQGALGQVLTIRKPPPNRVGSDITNWMKQIYGITDAVAATASTSEETPANV